MLRTLNSRQNLRLDMQSHEFGRTSLSNWDWDQATLRTISERKQSAGSTAEVLLVADSFSFAWLSIAYHILVFGYSGFSRGK